MALPKLKHSTFSIEVPSTKSKINCRPILAKDTKLIWNARVDQKYNDVLKAIKQVVNDCSGTQTVADNMTLFDLEYVYTQLYGHSTKEPHKLAFRDNEDNELRTFEIDFSKVTIKWPEKDLRTIKVNETVSLQLNYPSVNTILEQSDTQLSQTQSLEKVVLSSLKKIVDGDKVYDVTTEPVEDVKAWLDDLPSDAYDNLTEFFVNLPTINYEISYTNNNGTKRSWGLTNLNAFFNFVRV